MAISKRVTNETHIMFAINDDVRVYSNAFSLHERYRSGIQMRQDDNMFRSVLLTLYALTLYELP